MKITAEFSLYPLKTADVTPAIVEFIDCVREAGLQVQPGPISTLVTGEIAEVFPALQRAYELSCRQGAAVLVVKTANVGPAASESE
jgi:uncharacterized protein YqgV (UPF0045/DUF77 family)